MLELYELTTELVEVYAECYGWLQCEWHQRNKLRDEQPESEARECERRALERRHTYIADRYWTLVESQQRKIAMTWMSIYWDYLVWIDNARFCIGFPKILQKASLFIDTRAREQQSAD